MSEEYDKNERLLIGIPNWEKYQYALKGRGGAASRRSWVAVSVDLLSDPAYFDMPLVEREAWVGLLCHAGKVGVPMKLSGSDIRVMCKLPRTPSIRLLINQGLIESHAPTYKTDKQNIHNKGTDVLLGGKAKKKTVEKVDAKDDVDYYFPDAYPGGLNIDAWHDWVKHRQSLNLKKYTSFMLMNKLAKMPLDMQRKAVDHSIGMGYQGVFPEKFYAKVSKGQQEVDEMKRVIDSFGD